jgi:hypothetical protein
MPGSGAISNCDMKTVLELSEATTADRPRYIRRYMEARNIAG